jgi:thiamine biosynthesis lipoprotein ApbE
VADIVSTALFVLGPEAGLAWLGGRDDLAALFLVEEGGELRPRWNPAMEQYLVRRPTSTRGG